MAETSTLLLVIAINVLVNSRLDARTIQGCVFEERLYAEGESVSTEEPCLNCTCARGAPVCYLKVCPDLPDPPPSGCIVLHRKNHCCSQLICEDERKRVEEPGDHTFLDRTELQYRNGSGCVLNGTLYADGSAMATSSLCEYCYCIRGVQQCVLPKCVLQLPGCVPTFAKHACCPINYVCTAQNTSVSTQEVTAASTSSPSSSSTAYIGCHVDGVTHEEGSMVRSVASSDCENCFCVKGRVRCVPLAAAPPLQGCVPIVKAGECWPASYNCSGTTMDIQMTENNFILRNIIGERKFPSFIRSLPSTINKEKELLVIGRANNELINNTKNVLMAAENKTEETPPLIEKSTNKPTPKTTTPELVQLKKNTINTNSNSLNKTVEDAENLSKDSNVTIKLDTIPLNDSSSDSDYTSTTSIYTDLKTTNTATTDTETKVTTTDVDTTTSDQKATVTETDQYTTEIELDSTTTQSETTFTEETEFSTNTYSDNITTYATDSSTPMTTFDTPETASTNFPSTITTEANNVNTTASPETQTDVTVGENSNIPKIPMLLESKNDDNFITDNSPGTDDMEIKEPLGLIDLLSLFDSTTEVYEDSVTMIDKQNIDDNESPTTVLMPGDQYIVNITMHSNLSIKDSNKTAAIVTAQPPPLRAILPEVEATVNVTNKKDEDYEYDYNEPSLPPSLPNLRIIPFVAADAVLEKADKLIPIQEKHRRTDSPVFYKPSHPNLFSPPIETEGGFLPREPIIDGPFYESKFDGGMSYHTTNQNMADHLPLEITTTTPQSITMQPNSKDGTDNCVSSGRDYRHGELLSNQDACITCVCYYGEVHCHPPACPNVKPGCRRVKDIDRMACCGRIVCDKEESPTVVLDRIDITINPLQQPPHSGGGILPVTVADGVDISDPFRDVIRTEAAPDLPSLIGNMMPPYLLDRQTTEQTTTTTTPVPSLWSWNVSSVDPEEISERTTNLTTTTKSKLTESSTYISITSQQMTASRQNTSGTLFPVEFTTLTPQKVIDSEEPVVNHEEDTFSFDSMLKLFFSGEDDTTPAPSSSDHSTTEDHLSTAVFLDNHLAPTFQSIDRSDINIDESTSDKDHHNATEEIENNENKSVVSSQKTDLQQLLTISSQRPQNSNSETPPGRPPNLKRPFAGDPVAASGLLKLAGCNIYGRMYRVGRVISELSGPCLECMCTDVGVQCRPLKC